MLMCNFSPAKPLFHDADTLSLAMMSVNKSSAIISRRDIEKVTCLYESLFVQAEVCLELHRKHILHECSFLEQGAGMQLGPSSCILIQFKSVPEFQDIFLLRI